MDGLSLCGHLKGGGKAEIKSAEIGLLKIAINAQLEGERMVGVARKEITILMGYTCIGNTHKLMDIFFADGSIDTGKKLTGMMLVESVEIHLHLGTEGGAGGEETERRNAKTERIHRDVTFCMTEYQTALLPETELAERQTDNLSSLRTAVLGCYAAIEDRVYL